jgi:hypothetical protein
MPAQFVIELLAAGAWVVVAIYTLEVMAAWLTAAAVALVFYGGG